MAIGNLDGLSLSELLIGASEAPPNYRVQFRDPIALFGADAAVALEPWLLDASLGGFAARTIGKTAKVDRPAAVSILQRSLNADLLPFIRADVLEQLALLGAKPKGVKHGVSAEVDGDPVPGLDALQRGKVYRRRADIHAGKLGGNQQRGISYPAGGSYVLLFSDPAKVSEWGYNDRWGGENSYWYSGEWDGPGDMTMTGGNLQIIERSPNLYLFTAAPGGHIFQGTFRYDHHVREPATRDGLSAIAIVFQLIRDTMP